MSVSMTDPAAVGVGKPSPGGKTAVAVDPAAPAEQPADPVKLRMQTRAALVATVLLVAVSLVLFVGSLVETVILGGDPGASRLFDLVIRLASTSGPSTIVVALAYVLVVLLTFLISEKIDARLWNLVTYSALASLVATIVLYFYTGSGFYPGTFGGFRFVSDSVSPVIDSPDPKAMTDVMKPMYDSLRTWIIFGGFWNCFVFLSMVKNKVATDFLKRVIGIEL